MDLPVGEDLQVEGVQREEGVPQAGEGLLQVGVVRLEEAHLLDELRELTRAKKMYLCVEVGDPWEACFPLGVEVLV